MDFSIVLTNDYEVFGNGEGDITDNLIDPTNEMMSVMESNGCRHTIFCDVVEYWRFREAEDEGLFGPSYCGASMIEAQLRAAVKAGHDVQLHVHPQWLDASPLNASAWRVNEKYWRTPMVPGGLGSQNDRKSLRGLMYLAKQTLESLLKPVKPEYRCIAFRAGGYCIQPEGEVLQAMREAGLKIDSSVCPGRKSRRAPAYFDYRGAPTKLPCWSINDSVVRPTADGDLLELPIGTGRRPRVGVSGRQSSPLKSRVRRLVSPPIVNMDYCKQGGEELANIIDRRIRELSVGSCSGGCIPIVLMGHSKEWPGGDDLAQVIRWVKRRGDTTFMTITEWFEQYR